MTINVNSKQSLILEQEKIQKVEKENKFYKVIFNYTHDLNKVNAYVFEQPGTATGTVLCNAVTVALAMS